MRPGDVLFAAPVGDHQRLVAEHVDYSRCTLAGLADLSHRGFFESQAGTATGDAYAMVGVLTARWLTRRHQGADSGRLSITPSAGPESVSLTLRLRL